MNDAYLHLILNHIPITTTLVGIFFLGYGIGFKKNDVINISLTLLIFSSLALIPVYMTGEGAEEFIETLPSWSGEKHDKIESHEEAGFLSLALTLVLGCTCALTMFLNVKHKEIASRLKILCLILGLIAFVSLVRTGLTGGKVNHTELELDTEQK